MRFPRDRWQQTDRVNRASFKIQNACYLRPHIPLLSGFFRVWIPRTSAHCDLSAQIRFVPGCVRIREPFDSVLAQLTVPKNIPELVRHLEKSIFPRRRKLSFFTFRISMEHLNSIVHYYPRSSPCERVITLPVRFLIKSITSLRCRVGYLMRNNVRRKFPRT